jgi:hypothetical protein
VEIAASDDKLQASIRERRCCFVAIGIVGLRAIRTIALRKYDRGASHPVTGGVA